MDRCDSSDDDVPDSEIKALGDDLAKIPIQREKRSADDVVPGANDWAMVMGANNLRNKETSG